jgi:rSAM/selenodomain-associated transferase 1
MAVPPEPGVVVREVLLNEQYKRIKSVKNKKLLIVFARNQLFGRVKTRLAEVIGDELALKTYQILMTHTASIVSQVPCEKAIYFSEEISGDPIWKKVNGKSYVQKGNDLGERMNMAFEQAFEDGFENVIIIGCDLFDLELHHITNAFEMMEQNEVVIGPALDGGYYLLGLKNNNPLLFKNKNWGSSSVLKDTLIDLEDSNYSLIEELNDIDTYSDLKGNDKLLKLVYNDTKVKGEQAIFAEQRI